MPLEAYRSFAIYSAAMMTVRFNLEFLEYLCLTFSISCNPQRSISIYSYGNP